MNRTSKIIVYSILLLLAILYKHGPSIKNTPDRTVRERPGYSPRPTTKSPSSTTNKLNEDVVELDKRFKDLDNLELPEIEPLYPLSVRPQNGTSPYDSHYGSGVYKQTDNSIEVTAPIQVDIVFLLKDLSTNQMIRNEFIRAGEIFTLTKVPYGRYKFYYTYGKGWSEEAPFKSKEGLGNFTRDEGLSTSDDPVDFEFNRGYYGTYTLKLQMVQNGNLETRKASENEI